MSAGHSRQQDARGAVARRKWRQAPEDTGRWLISYADFITLLFAFFTVMYALSTINETRYRVMSESLGAAFTQRERAVIVELDEPQMGGAFTRGYIAESFRRVFSSDFRRISSALAELERDETVAVSMHERGVVISFKGAVLFEQEGSELTAEGRRVIDEAAGLMTDPANYYRIEGHTDNSAPAGFASNWELSSARATAVLRYMVEVRSVPASKVSAVGYGEYRPRASNDTEMGRLLNDRIDIILLDAGAALFEPGAVGG
jgi:chemotaxis protein MotB